MTGALEKEFRDYTKKCLKGEGLDVVEAQRAVFYTGAYAAYWLMTGFMSDNQKTVDEAMKNIVALNAELKAYSADLRQRAAAAKSMQRVAKSLKANERAVKKKVKR